MFYNQIGLLLKTLFFDDTQENITAAKQFGIKSWHVTDKNTVARYFANYDFSIPGKVVIILYTETVLSVMLF